MSAAEDTPTRDGDPPGIDLQRLASYLDEQRPGLLRGPLSAEVIPGGRSNLTYDVTDGISQWVVRRPPLGHVLATAHDMSREYRVISALAEAPVPVPETVVLCEDPDVVGAPFYVMAKVPGTPYRKASQLEPLGPQRTRAICQGMVDCLAALHTVDPAQVGLADFGRPEGFLERQVRRWKKQLDASRSRDVAGIDELHSRLEQRIPPQAPTAVVHGDYRLDNLLVDDRDQITAVLDWEMATLGDPLTDLGMLVSYEGMSDLTGGEAVSDAMRAPGFLSTAEMIDRYASASGTDISELGFYVALAHFKIAVILEGIHYRFTQGDTVGGGFESIGALVEPVVAAGLRAFEEH
ncbi:phosphotransferase family protein [Lipingzhangella sp. LS1_29]|uniref:Phosphotransferase family protein n=1 Tax=Lipingzhangella rawalii TaxID=2055835 RepID=A0ABU2H956_9ACTN|nr:phosphotransferase family protein [Lipingzhangella rawalii]MDS1271532.1 phosphotransferase family protein [Lipingzhangella rawalii]